jgi:hypothetical protein
VSLGEWLARAIWVTALCLLAAWVLMVSYQIFTKTALTTVASSVGGSVPFVAAWINSGADLAVFIFGFAWMFLLSAIMSTLMFGKERRLSIQFLVSLALTLTGSALLALVNAAGVNLANPGMFASAFAVLFGNAFFAVFYLALPFIFMLAIDLRALKKRKIR